LDIKKLSCTFELLKTHNAFVADLRILHYGFSAFWRNVLCFWR